MKCIEFESILADYIDGTLAARERSALEEHVAGCANCREFMQEVQSGLGLLESAPAIQPPPDLITRIAYLAPQGRVRDPFEQQSALSKLISRWLMPVLQPRLAMGMAMTILSFAMLKRCTGIEVHEIQPADLNPVRVWGSLEDKAMRVKDQAVKYYENLRIVYEIESHLRDLQATQSTPRKNSNAATADRSKSANRMGNGASQSSKGNKP